MPRNAQAQVSEGDFTQNTMPPQGHGFKEAATHWAGTVKESVRSNMVKAGYQAETCVRSHPGSFIVGACCVGLAAGWFLGRTTKRS